MKSLPMNLLDYYTINYSSYVCMHAIHTLYVVIEYRFTNDKPIYLKKL